MSFPSDATRTSTSAKRNFELDLSGGDGDWPDETKRGRDWKKAVLVIGLGVLSWVATYIGMLELIESNMGDLPLIHKAVIGFSVAMLMTMIIWLLDQMFSPASLPTKMAFAAGYIFLTIISVGFGFGFYWKVLESRSESSRSAESAVTQVQSSLHAASTRMTQLSTTLEQLTQLSTQKAEIERAKGASCPDSRPGDGPRRKLRDEDAQRFGFAADFVKGRVGTVKNDLAALDGDLARIVSDDKSTVDAASGTRNDFMRALGRKLDITVTGFNAFRTDPQLKQLRADLAERSEKTVFADSRGGTFACPDPQLQQALKGVVRAIDQLPDLEKPKIAAVEGSEATIEAFRRLTATFYGLLSFKLPPSADELRDLQKKAVQSVEATPATHKALAGDATVGLSKRDYIPLAIAIFVDLCLLLVSMSRPMNRLHGLVPKMRAAERGPVIQILSRFNEIHRDDEIRQNFEVFRHVVFDFHGAYYVAVPLDAPYKPAGPYTKSYSTEDIQDLQLEAHLLANLFTSFEQEKIFSRVYSPLLTTRAVKKKLLRQGSKFAHAEAFRVYRFRDGAWSEIILGAVMGAARRVEAEKKKRRLEQQLFTSTEPTLSASTDRSATRTASETQATPAPVLVADAAPNTQSNLSVAAATRGGFFSRRAREGIASAAPPSLDSNSTAEPSSAIEFGPYAARATREIAEERYRSTLPTLRGEDGALDRPRSRRRGSRDTGGRPAAAGEEELAARDAEKPAGEVVLFALPGSSQAELGKATPSATTSIEEHAPRTSDSASASPPASIRQEPDAAPIPTMEPRVGIIVRRETAEFTMPVTEATLPGALLAAKLGAMATGSGIVAALASARMLGDGVGAAPNSAVANAPAIEPVAQLPPPLPTTPAKTSNAGATYLDLEPLDLDDEEPQPLFAEPDVDIRVADISRRFRPSAAE